MHEALTEVPELGLKATTCSSVAWHRPRPLRYVLHHILPQVCGGLTVETNLVSLCDNCHYSVHVLLWQLAHGLKLPRSVNAHQLLLATQGYSQAQKAGTVGKIPKVSVPLG
jgi:hypothetical protein